MKSFSEILQIKQTEVVTFSEPRAVSDAHFGRRVRARRFGRECRARCGRPQNSFIARAKMSFRARFGLAAHRKIIARVSDICLSPNISRTPHWTLQNALKMLQNAPADCWFACFFACFYGWFDCLVVFWASGLFSWDPARETDQGRLDGVSGC